MKPEEEKKRENQKRHIKDCVKNGNN